MASMNVWVTGVLLKPALDSHRGRSGGDVAEGSSRIEAHQLSDHTGAGVDGQRDLTLAHQAGNALDAFESVVGGRIRGVLSAPP